jgi:hypothetical protein
LVCQLVRYNDSKAYILQAKNMAFKKSAWNIDRFPFKNIKKDNLQHRLFSYFLTKFF